MLNKGERVLKICLVHTFSIDFPLGRQFTELLSNVDNLFTALSSCCDIIKQLASFTGIKFTKQELVS